MYNIDQSLFSYLTSSLGSSNTQSLTEGQPLSLRAWAPRQHRVRLFTGDTIYAYVYERVPNSDPPRFGWYSRQFQLSSSNLYDNIVVNYTSIQDFSFDYECVNCTS